MAKKLKRPILATIIAVLNIISGFGIIVLVVVFFGSEKFDFLKNLISDTSKFIFVFFAIFLSLVMFISGTGLLCKKLKWRRWGWIFEIFALGYAVLAIINTLVSLLLLQETENPIEFSVRWTIFILFLIYYFNQVKVSEFFGVKKNERKNLILKTLIPIGVISIFIIISWL